MMKKEFNKKIIFFLALIIIFGFTLRLYGISKESYWLDESITLRQAQANWPLVWEWTKMDIHPPLYTFVLFFWVRLFGISELSTHLLSAIFGTFAILLIFLITKKLFSEKEAIISALLLAFSPILIYFSQETRNYSLFILLTLLSFYFFIRYLEKNQTKYLIYYYIASLLLLYTHLFSLLILFVQNAYLSYLFRKKIKKQLKWFITQSLLFISFLPWIPILLGQINGPINRSWIETPTLGTILLTLTVFLGNKYLLCTFIVVLLIFIIKKRHETNEKVLLLIFWIIFPFFIVISYSLLFPSVYIMRYMLITLPSFIILFAFMIEKISPNQIIKWTIIAFILISSLITINNQVISIDKDDWKGATDYLKQNIKENEMIFIHPFYHQDVFSYYYNPVCFNDTDICSCNFDKKRITSLSYKEKESYDDSLVLSTNNHKQLKDYVNNTIWLVSVRAELLKTNTSLYDYFNTRKNLTQTKEFDGVIMIYKFE